MSHRVRIWLVSSILGDVTTLRNPGDYDTHYAMVSVKRSIAAGEHPGSRMIREQVKYGADWIKVMATGGVMSAGDDPTHTAYVDEEMRAAVDETHRLVRLGMSPMDAIRAATWSAAQVLGIEDEVGTLQPGMVADIIAVDGNPLDDITELEQVDFVMKDGQIIKDARPRT